MKEVTFMGLKFSALLFDCISQGGSRELSPRDTHGPIVKTGPTAGQNRSRNNDGTWRKKRSDAGQKRRQL